MVLPSLYPRFYWQIAGCSPAQERCETVKKGCERRTKQMRKVRVLHRGAPGAVPTWSNAQKVGIGTSFEAYDANGQYSDNGPTGVISKVWFSLGKDRITEVMWGLIHEAQIREIRFVVTGPEGIIEPDEYIYDLHSPRMDGAPDAPMTGVYAVHDTYSLLWSVYTDPDRDSLVIGVGILTERQDLKVFALIDPALGNTGGGDRARVTATGVHAGDGEAHLYARFSGSVDAPRSVGFVGSSDGLSDVADGRLDDLYDTTGDAPGNVAIVMTLPFSHHPWFGPQADLVIGFGRTEDEAKRNADETAAIAPLDVYSKYVEQWADYLDTLEYLPTLAEASSDGGKLAYMSAINLKVDGGQDACWRTDRVAVQPLGRHGFG